MYTIRKHTEDCESIISKSDSAHENAEYLAICEHCEEKTFVYLFSGDETCSHCGKRASLNWNLVSED